MNSGGEAELTEVEVGTFARRASVAVEAVGRRLIDVGFGADGSLLTPGQPVWTLANLDALERDYVDKPDTGGDGFFDKLKRQLAGAPPAVVQLYAELFILNVLPIINVSGPLKVKQVRTVLEMSSEPVHLPGDVEAALFGGGVLNGGQAFTTSRWAQIAFLIQVARHFKSLPDQRRKEALADPLIFREEVNAVPSGQVAQRQSLLYLAFPQFFLPIVKIEHRTALRDGFADDYLIEPSGDLDIDLARIYSAIVEAEGGHVDVYAEPWVSRWRKPTPGTEPTDQVRHAWKVHGSNVKGQDMVPIWRAKQSVSLAASLLRPIDPYVTRGSSRRSSTRTTDPRATRPVRKRSTSSTLSSSGCIRVISW